MIVDVAVGRPAALEGVRMPDGATAQRDALVAELWTEHYARLAGWCRALVGDADAAHDVAAEAFVRLMAKWRTVEDPRGFLYVTALNVVRDGWRRAATGRRLVDRLRGQRATIGAEPGWLGDVLQRLPEHLQAPVLLHYYADLGVDAVAATLGRPAGTIKRQLSDARALLAPMVAEEEQ